MSNKNRFLIIILCFLIFIFTALSFVFFKDKKEIYNIKTNTSDIIKKSNDENKLSFEKMIKKLPSEYNSNNLVGFINFTKNNKNIPVMQGKDNEYYLSHTPDGKENYIGSIFLDYRLDIDKSKKLLIYGHSSRNEELPFNFLQNYYSDKDYFLENKNIEIITTNNKKSYEIFSIYIETKDFSYMKTDFIDDNEYLSHIENLKNKSIYKTSNKLSKKDEILILQTCSTHKDYKKYANKYLLIIARRV